MPTQIQNYKPEIHERKAEQKPAGARVPQPIRKGDEEIWLLGLPPLSKLLTFVRDTVVDAAAVDRAALTAEWRAGEDYFEEAEKSGGGRAKQGNHPEGGAGAPPPAPEGPGHPPHRPGF